MKPLKGLNTKPEAKLADRLKKFLEDHDWVVMNIHGNLYQKGLPDKYCFHQKYKQRWVEVKVPTRYKFTNSQIINFPLIDRCGIGIWILTADTEEEYGKLFAKPNWKKYLKKRDIEKIKELYDWFKYGIE